jgi:Mg2+/citrate symporter
MHVNKAAHLHIAFIKIVPVPFALLAHNSMCSKIIAVQEIRFQDGIFLNALQASSMLPHFAYMLIKLLPTKASNSQPL